MPLTSKLFLTCGPMQVRLFSKRPARAVLEADQAADVVLVLDLAHLAALDDEVARAHALGHLGSLPDESLLLGQDALDGTDEVLGHVYRVGHDVPEYSEARAVELVAPGQRPIRVGGVVGEEVAAVVRDLPELAGSDELFGVLHRRDVPVHQADSALHPGLLDGLPDLVRLGRYAPARFLQPDVLAGLGRGDGDLAVEVVGRGDAHRFDLGVLYDLPPVRGPALVPEKPRGLPRAFLDRVGRHDQPRLERAIGVVVEQTPVASAMHLTHPSQPDYSTPISLLMFSLPLAVEPPPNGPILRSSQASPPDRPSPA